MRNDRTAPSGRRPDSEVRADMATEMTSNRPDTQEPPAEIFDQGQFFLDIETWQNKEVSDAQIETAARRLMGMSGQEAISALVDAIERLGPRIGSEIVREGLGRPSSGPGAQYWTKLFMYAWKHHGILRYMSKRDGSGHSRYCTLEQANRNRTL